MRIRDDGEVDTHPSKQDFLQPILAIRITTREEVHVVCRILKEVQVIGRLDGKNERLWSFVETRDVVGIKIRERA